MIEEIPRSPARIDPGPEMPGFRRVPRTGVIYVMHRAAAAMGEMNLGHFIPDYTAYEELLSAFKGFIPIPILLDAAHGYRASRRLLLKEIVGRGLSALWCSNP